MIPKKLLNANDRIVLIGPSGVNTQDVPSFVMGELEQEQGILLTTVTHMAST